MDKIKKYWNLFNNINLQFLNENIQYSITRSCVLLVVKNVCFLNRSAVLIANGQLRQSHKIPLLQYFKPSTGNASIYRVQIIFVGFLRLGKEKAYTFFVYAFVTSVVNNQDVP